MAAIDLKTSSLRAFFRSDVHGDRRHIPVDGWHEFNRLLSGGGWPSASVVELGSPRVLSGLTRVALLTARSVQAENKDAWVVWIDPEQTLYAPGVAKLGVDLSRLLVVTTPRTKLDVVAKKVTASGAFQLVVIDWDPIGSTASRRASIARPDLLVRRLALLAEQTGALVLLLREAESSKMTALPVAMRVAFLRKNPNTLEICIQKNRYGPTDGMPHCISWPTQPLDAIPSMAGDAPHQESTP